ncbi:MAG: hypothetical protein QM729_13265 [Solirubrobacterales bacterium]
MTAKDKPKLPNTTRRSILIGAVAGALAPTPATRHLPAAAPA